MGLTLWRFGEMVLPEGLALLPVGSGPAREAISATVGGFYDHLGTARAELALPYDLVYRAVLSEDSAAGVLAALRPLKAQRGALAKLFRRHADGRVEWCWARLRQAPAQRDARRHVWSQPLTLVWTVESAWYGPYRGEVALDAGQSLDDGLYLDSAQVWAIDQADTVLSLANYGDAPCTRALLRVRAGDVDITGLSLALYRQGTVSIAAQLAFSGTIGAGKYLVVNCGAKSALNDGQPAGATFGPTVQHRSHCWLPLAVGINSLLLHVAGGGPGTTLSIAYAEELE